MSSLAPRADGDRSRKISPMKAVAPHPRRLGALDLLSNSAAPARASGRWLATGGAAVSHGRTAPMPSTTPPDKLASRHHTLLRRRAPRPRLRPPSSSSDASTSLRCYPRRSKVPPHHIRPRRPSLPRHVTAPAPRVATRHCPRRQSPSCARAGLASPRSEPESVELELTMRRAVSLALGSTRARRPKAEHAGRTTPHPPGGINSFAPRR